MEGFLICSSEVLLGFLPARWFPLVQVYSSVTGRVNTQAV